MGETVEIDALDSAGRFSAYLAMPEGKPVGAIVVIQEIFGVNQGIREKVDGWARQGYVGIAHDMFWRFAPGVELDADVPEELQRAFGLFGEFKPDDGVKDIEATIRLARDKAGGRKVGVVGYCLGGRMAYLAATRTDTDASVGYYGAGIDAVLGEAHAIAHPLMLHFAGADHIVPPEAVAAIESGLAGNPHVIIHDYPGVDHGFAATAGARRVEAAARLADERTAAFFAANLRGDAAG